MNNLEAYKLVLDYVQICTKSLDKEQFGKIISEDVELNRQTNDEEPVIAKGREDVVQLFTRYIFSNSSSIQVHKSNMLPQGEKITLHLKVTENKEEDKKVNRYVFEETSIFEFKKNETYQISRIETVVKRTLV